MRDDLDAAGGDVVEVDEKSAGRLAHDDDLGRELRYVTQDGALVAGRLVQHRVQGGDDGGVDVLHELDHQVAVIAAEDAELMLQGHRAQVAAVQGVGSLEVVTADVLTDLVAHLRGVEEQLAGAFEGDDLDRWRLGGSAHGPDQIAGEGGDAADAGAVCTNDTYGWAGRPRWSAWG
jgi:hypothetical protein